MGDGYLCLSGGPVMTRRTTNGIRRATGGIGRTTALTAAALTWETATDWDNAVSESGVYHEEWATADTRGDAGRVKIGYSYDTPYLDADLAGYWPMAENSGTTVYDYSGNNDDGTLNGGDTNRTGINESGAVLLDGVDDNIDNVSPSHDSTIGGLALSFWVRPDFDTATSANNNETVLRGFLDGNNNYAFLYNGNSAAGDWMWQWSSSNVVFNSTTNYQNNWLHVVTTADTNQNCQVYFDGTQVFDGSFGSGQTVVGDIPLYIGSNRDNGDNWPGEIADVRVYDTHLTSSDAQTLYDIATGPGTLTTATKSFTSAQTPDLTADFTYDDETKQTHTIDVIGSPGTASEETVTQVLTSGQSSYSLSWSNSHTDFRSKMTIESSDITINPAVVKLELVA